jgi:SAM-dependent methyltransferase
MQAYSEGFAHVYNMRWSGFVRQVAPLILDFYAATPVGQTNKSVLDLCCGTGQLARHFLEEGYRVVGLDLSEPMLRYAHENTRPYVEMGQAEFIRGNASDFSLTQRFGLVVSTYDSLNHLPDEAALRRCFQCVYAVSEGYFIFDLNTRLGLQRWNSINIDDGSEEVTIINRGLFDEQSGKAWVRISGFLRRPDGLYERFEETAFNTAFDLEWVKNALLEAGWRWVYFARVQELSTPLTEPEKEGRVFIVAGKE